MSLRTLGSVAGSLAQAQAKVLAVSATTSSNGIEITGVPSTIATGILSLLVLATLATLAMRIGQREVTSLVFAAANVLGHAGMLYYMLFTADTNALPLVFGLAYATGEGIKLRFLAVSGYTEDGPGTSPFFVTTLIAIYIAFAILAGIIS